MIVTSDDVRPRTTVDSQVDGGLELRDVTLTTPKGKRALTGAVRVQRTKDRRGNAWVTGTLKTKRSARTAAAPPWLAAKVADYLANTHGDPTNPTTPFTPFTPTTDFTDR